MSRLFHTHHDLWDHHPILGTPTFFNQLLLAALCHNVLPFAASTFQDDSCYFLLSCTSFCLTLCLYTKIVLIYDYVRDCKHPTARNVWHGAYLIACIFHIIFFTNILQSSWNTFAVHPFLTLTAFAMFIYPALMLIALIHDCAQYHSAQNFISKAPVTLQPFHAYIAAHSTKSNLNPDSNSKTAPKS